jgi:hypothetical protein
MRADATQNDPFDPVAAWTRQRERFHRARVLRLLLPGLAPLLFVVLLAVGVVGMPDGVVEAVLWAVTAAVYGAFWAYLIRDARRFVDEAAATDQRFRTLMGATVADAAAPAAVAVPADGPVVALAGRRVDARHADVARFPLASVGAVQDRLRAYLQSVRPSALVCSAASGADLLALEIAAKMGVRRRVILPFDRARFKQTSVTDRQGSWGPLYDHALDRLPAADLVVLGDAGAGTAAYEATNQAILDEAQALAARVATAPGSPAGPDVVALLVWDGRSRGEGDLTASFGQEARRRGIPVEHIATL